MYAYLCACIQHMGWVTFSKGALSYFAEQQTGRKKKGLILTRIMCGWFKICRITCTYSVLVLKAGYLSVLLIHFVFVCALQV